MFAGRSSSSSTSKTHASLSSAMVGLALLCSTFLIVLDIDHVTAMSLDRLALERNEILEQQQQHEQQQQNPEEPTLVVDDMELEALPARGDTEMYVLLPVGSDGVDKNIIDYAAEMDAAEHGGDMLMMESNDESGMQVVQMPELLAELQRDSDESEDADAEEEAVNQPEEAAMPVSESNETENSEEPVKESAEQVVENVEEPAKELTESQEQHVEKLEGPAMLESAEESIDTTTRIALMLAEIAQQVAEASAEEPEKDADVAPASMQDSADDETQTIENSEVEQTDDAVTEGKQELPIAEESTESEMTNEAAAESATEQIDEVEAESVAQIIAEAVEEAEQAMEAEAEAVTEAEAVSEDEVVSEAEAVTETEDLSMISGHQDEVQEQLNEVPSDAQEETTVANVEQAHESTVEAGSDELLEELVNEEAVDNEITTEVVDAAPSVPEALEEAAKPESIESLADAVPIEAENQEMSDSETDSTTVIPLENEAANEVEAVEETANVEPQASEESETEAHKDQEEVKVEPEANLEDAENEVEPESHIVPDSIQTEVEETMAEDEINVDEEPIAFDQDQPEDSNVPEAIHGEPEIADIKQDDEVATPLEETQSEDTETYEEKQEESLMVEEEKDNQEETQMSEESLPEAAGEVETLQEEHKYDELEQPFEEHKEEEQPSEEQNEAKQPAEEIREEEQVVEEQKEEEQLVEEQKEEEQVAEEQKEEEQPVEEHPIEEQTEQYEPAEEQKEQEVPVEEEKEEEQTVEEEKKDEQPVEEETKEEEQQVEDHKEEEHLSEEQTPVASEHIVEEQMTVDETHVPVEQEEIPKEENSVIPPSADSTISADEVADVAEQHETEEMQATPELQIVDETPVEPEQEILVSDELIADDDSSAQVSPMAEEPAQENLPVETVKDPQVDAEIPAAVQHEVNSEAEVAEEAVNKVEEEEEKPAALTDDSANQNETPQETTELLQKPQNTEVNSILTTIVQVPPQQLQPPIQSAQSAAEELPSKVPNVAVMQPTIQMPILPSQASINQKPLNVMDSVLNYVNASFLNNNNNHNDKTQQKQQDESDTFNSKLRRYDGAQVWRIVVQNDRDKKLADQLQTKFDGQLWKEVKAEVDYLLKPQVLADAEKHIRAANLSRIVLIDNLQKVIEVENPPAEEIAQLQNRKGHRMTWQAYHRLADIHGFFDYLAKTYPDICSVETIGYSIQKRQLKILKISNGNPGNPGIWIDGGMHAREWISPASVTYIANQIVEGWDDLPEYMRNVNWYIHAVANPDGYEYSHTTDRLWRKNMRSHGRQCPGVDLNRNFGYKWGGKGTSANPCAQTYRGSNAFSEPETFYISKFISNFPRDTFHAYLSFHSYGQYILYPWGYDYQVTKDRSDLERVARQAGTIITKSSGVKYTVGASATTLYPAAGGSDDWAKGFAGIKYAYTIEMGDTGRYGFVLPAGMIESNGKDGYTFVQTVARAVTKQDMHSRKRSF